MEEIVAALEAEGTDWASKTLKVYYIGIVSMHNLL